MHRRIFLLGALTATLAACEAEPLVDQAQAATIVPGNIVVDTSAISGIEGRELVVAPAQINADLTGALKTALKRPGAPNADVYVTVKKVQLVSRGASVAFAQSNIQAVLQVRNRAGGADIIAPTEITGLSEQFRLGGVIGVVTAPTAEQDYQQTIRGFAASVGDRLFGAPADS